MAKALGRVAYGLYAWTMFGLVALPTWALTALAPNPATAWRVNAVAARLLLLLCGIAITVRGRENQPREPCVLVANHASFLDGLALFVACPGPFAFVAKRSFLEHPVARIYLQALGTQFVERSDISQSVEDASRLADIASAGSSMAFFPEGTFRHMPGLAAFRLGAFASAVAAQAPVLPVAIRGMRSVLRDGQWLPRRGPVTVTIGAPLRPPTQPSGAFAAAVALRDAARAHILANCGEPDAGPG
jgi:1-acyl-sn-glycerol-3-phosphate acyltransferase